MQISPSTNKKYNFYKRCQYLIISGNTAANEVQLRLGIAKPSVLRPMNRVTWCSPSSLVGLLDLLVPYIMGDKSKPSTPLLFLSLSHP